jgi:hypothetical protein
MTEQSAENDTPCEPYITQDGYDSGQVFVCPTHDVYEPVMGDDGRQTYEVTLPAFQRLVDEHRASIIPPREDQAELGSTPWRHTGPLLPGERVVPPGEDQS